MSLSSGVMDSTIVAVFAAAQSFQDRKRLKAALEQSWSRLWFRTKFDAGGETVALLPDDILWQRMWASSSSG